MYGIEKEKEAVKGWKCLVRGEKGGYLFRKKKYGDICSKGVNKSFWDDEIDEMEVEIISKKFILGDGNDSVKVFFEVAEIGRDQFRKG